MTNSIPSKPRLDFPCTFRPLLQWFPSRRNQDCWICEIKDGQEGESNFRDLDFMPIKPKIWEKCNEEPGLNERCSVEGLSRGSILDGTEEGTLSQADRMQRNERLEFCLRSRRRQDEHELGSHSRRDTCANSVFAI